MNETSRHSSILRLEKNRFQVWATRSLNVKAIYFPGNEKVMKTPYLVKEDQKKSRWQSNRIWKKKEILPVEVNKKPQNNLKVKSN